MLFLINFIRALSIKNPKPRLVDDHGGPYDQVRLLNASPSTTGLELTSTQYLHVGSRLMFVSATQPDRVHRHVFRAESRPDKVEQWVLFLLTLLPRVIQKWCKSSYPEWFLPSSIVLKQRKEGWDEEFQNEKAIYQILRPLEGTVVPIYYGQGHWQGKETFVFSDIGGHCMCEPEACQMDLDQFRKLLQEAFEALGTCGVIHDDHKLDNYHLVNGRIMVVDMEMATESRDQKEIALCAKYAVDHLSRAYRSHQDSLRHDGLI